ncbi:dihydrolipoamide acetyltransferase family protein [Saccharothrix australiensis]|uniref:Dihydrolipoamide acetyltransferase component of pyruvate dehydrogenase complex n=1 Tax=Saccharothrix australiensis TaxID=2072 RepID=A0A495W399_9PSEU|nr:dihydrolipoamide acetyltransferase family protein [Saccharothrix australiensis]RKT56191.1 pyruvate dehydrogenase E2 component (dihydrolipoamide acetyltransferase) [Saccharothrix australiensis]
MPDFRLPDLGEGLTEGEIVAWLVSVGDHVSVDQPVVEVETAKAVVEVPCPFEGVVRARFGEPGEKLAVGSVLLSVGADEPAGASSGSGNVLIGYGTSEAPRRRRSGRRGPGGTAARPVLAPQSAGAQSTGPQPAGAESAGPRSVESRSSGSRSSGSRSSGSRSVESWSVASSSVEARTPLPRAPEPSTTAPAVISPFVRRMARENGLALDRITGTGPGGVIRRTDVERALAAAHQAEARSADSNPDQDSGRPAAARRIPLRGLRGAVAEKLTRSRREIPEATVWVDVDATDFLAARAALPSVSLLGLLARFTVLGLKRFPELNSRVEGDEVVVLDEVHLGFAAQTDRGLVVPVVRDAHALTTSALSSAIDDLATSAREGRIAPASLTGGTFTVNNYGVFGVDGSAAIINHPEAAILGLGRIIDRPWAVDGQLAVRKVAQLTLAFDHRVCDGGTAGGFLRFVADCVEAPITALSWV